MSVDSFGLKMNEPNIYKFSRPACQEGETVKLGCKFAFKKRCT